LRHKQIDQGDLFIFSQDDENVIARAKHVSAEEIIAETSTGEIFVNRDDIYGEIVIRTGVK